MKVLGISGSLRRGSHNTRLLRSAAALLADGDELEVFQGLKAIPAFDEDDEHSPPEAVLALRRAIGEADAVLVATPEYNSSIPGHLKNALDWMSRPKDENPLRDKPAAVVGASTGMFGAVWSQAEARKVLASIGARVVDEELPVLFAHEQFDGDGVLAEAQLRERYEAILVELRGLAEAREPVGAAA
ncbi:MAG: NAD(P)H-dependent oxidoreductase [Actinomycetota bacterium]|nr:NAD(P)H-dependent oxidoreductase [Actinomycetota bacterium]MDQ3647966.1 NAD(P)H-dependent oxidoreductase [Actinomycetota bacterium]